MSSLANRAKRVFRLPVLSVLGVLLVPLMIAGLLSWSLASPGERLKDVKAAVVNEDEPVEVDGNLAPLGRQLSAKLVGGDIESNYTWEFATKDTAKEGLADGTYAAVVTIPKNFSEAATSFSRDPKETQRAKIDVKTGDRSRLADDAVSRIVTNTAANLLGEQLTTTYLDNIYVGFNSLNDQLGSAADGASGLADGAGQLADGTGKLSGGARELANGTRGLADGIGKLDEAGGQLSTGISGLSDGLGQLRDQTSEIPGQVGMLADVSEKENEGVKQITGTLGTMSEDLQDMMKRCPPGTLPICNDIAKQALTAKALSEGAGGVQQASDGIHTGLGALAGKTPESGGGLPALTGGIDQLAGGAAQLDDGMKQYRGGISQTKDGADKLADGADQLAGGVDGIGDGAHKLSDGNRQLSDGLHEAVDKLPTYPDGERDQLAKTVANPVETSSGTSVGFGSSGLSSYAVLALWIGALATFFVTRSLPQRVLESTRSSFNLALRAIGVPTALAVGQGLLVTLVLGITGDFSAGQWWGCAALASVIAVAFTLVNQVLVAALKGTGRFLSVAVAFILLATSFIAAVPALLNQLISVLPVGPAVDALRTLTVGAGPVTASVALLVIWALGAIAVLWLVIERRRTVSWSSVLSGMRGNRTAEAMQ